MFRICPQALLCPSSASCMQMVDATMSELQALDGALRVKNTEQCLQHLGALEASLRGIEAAAAKRQS